MNHETFLFRHLLIQGSRVVRHSFSESARMRDNTTIFLLLSSKFENPFGVSAGGESALESVKAHGMLYVCRHPGVSD